MIPLNDVGVVSNLTPSEVQSWMESADLHHTKTVGGLDLICLNSMIKRVRKARDGEPTLCGSPAATKNSINTKEKP